MTLNHEQLDTAASGLPGFDQTGTIPNDQFAEATQAVGEPTAELHSTKNTIEEIIGDEDLDAIDPLYFDKIDDPKILEVLFSHCDATGISPKDFIVNSSSFSILAAKSGGLYGEEVVIPEHPDNLHNNGMQRRSESGPFIGLEFLETQNVDPKKVLFFRVTQPSDQPKAEYYWTSDPQEVQSGLNQELGESAETAVIMVSTLHDINQNGGLIRDGYNDDQGLAVRQIGLQPFDQKRALGIFTRAAEQ